MNVVSANKLEVFLPRNYQQLSSYFDTLSLSLLKLASIFMNSTCRFFLNSIEAGRPRILRYIPMTVDFDAKCERLRPCGLVYQTKTVNSHAHIPDPNNRPSWKMAFLVNQRRWMCVCRNSVIESPFGCSLLLHYNSVVQTRKSAMRKECDHKRSAFWLYFVKILSDLTTS